MTKGNKNLFYTVLVSILISLILPVCAPLAHAGDGRKDLSGYVENIEKIAAKSLSLYKAGRPQDAKREWEAAYFENFEYLEGPIRRNISVKRNAELEGEFSRIRAMMRKGEPYSAIETAVKGLLTEVRKTLIELNGARGGISLFFYSLFIILREGFEAILIICAIISYLIKTGHRDKVKVIYSGCLIAIILSVITAVLVKWVFHVSGASQEILEGATMLLAVVVLFFVSFWLISKVEAHKWTSYIKEKVDSSLNAGSMYALWFAAFLSVYREGAETVLFYQALGAGSDARSIGIISGGFIVGCAALVIIFIGARLGSTYIPMKPFFIATSALLYYMAFVFAGKGMMELIEGKLVEPSLITNGPNLPAVGIYPYWQTIIPQGLLIATAIGGLYLMFRSRDRESRRC